MADLDSRAAQQPLAVTPPGAPEMEPDRNGSALNTLDINVIDATESRAAKFVETT